LLIEVILLEENCVIIEKVPVLYLRYECFYADESKWHNEIDIHEPATHKNSDREYLFLSILCINIFCNNRHQHLSGIQHWQPIIIQICGIMICGKDVCIMKVIAYTYIHIT
jgi:hypothetical protein